MSVACSRRGFGLGLGAGLLALAAPPRPAGAHPFHTTTAEARVAPTSMTLQVSLRVLPEDLEEALRRRTGARRPLEQVDDADIVAYLRHAMRWRHDGGTRMPPRWVGKEVSVREAWLHFDYRLPTAAQTLQLDHRVFFELEDDQINTLEFGAGPHARTVSLTREGSTASFAIADKLRP